MRIKIKWKGFVHMKKTKEQLRHEIEQIRSEMLLTGQELGLTDFKTIQLSEKLDVQILEYQMEFTHK